MNPFDFLNPGRWLLLLAACAALIAGGYALVDHIGDVREAQVDARWKAAVDKQKVEAAGKLADETGKVLKIERELGAARAAQETRDAKNRKTVAGLERRLADAAAANGGRLRDPNAAGCGGSGGSAETAVAAGADDRAGDGAKTGGLLSVQLSDLLRARLRDADEINIAYASCRADSLKLRATPP